MSERTCPHCGKAIIDREARWCAYCWQGLDLEAPPLAPPAPAPPEEAPAPPPAPPAAPRSGGEPGAPQPGTPTPPAEPSAGPAAPVGGAIGPSWPPDGLRRCTDCGEALYGVERVCWNCGRRLDLSAPEPAAPLAPPALAAPAPPTGLPMPPQGSPAAAPAAQIRADRPAPPEAMGTAWWAFGLGLASVFTCGLLGILGPIAIWLGLSASRRGGGPVAVAGTVLGVIATFVLVLWLLALGLALAGYLASGTPDQALLSLASGGRLCSLAC